MTKNHGLTPLENVNPCFVVLDGLIYFYKVTKHFVFDYFAKKQKGVNFPFFIKNRGLTLKQKCQIFNLLKSTFFWFNYNVKKHFASDYLAEKKEKTFKVLTKNQGKKGKTLSNF